MVLSAITNSLGGHLLNYYMARYVMRLFLTQSIMQRILDTISSVDPALWCFLCTWLTPSVHACWCWEGYMEVKTLCLGLCCDHYGFCPHGIEIFKPPRKQYMNYRCSYVSHNIRPSSVDLCN